MDFNKDYYVFNDCPFTNGFFVKPYKYGNDLSNDELDLTINKIKDILDVDKIIFVKQEHTDIIKKVTLDNIDNVMIADGMITDVKGIGLMIKVADCQAIYLYDSKKNVIANIHSGWRGTIKKIVGKAVDMMINDYNCNINDIKVMICPSILKDHFEVDMDCYLMFKEVFNDIDKYTLYNEKLNKYYIDLESLNKDYLISLGIDKENITLSKICSVCNDNIYSYRRDKTSLRNLAVIVNN